MGRRDEEDKNKIRRRKAASSNSNSSNSSSSSNNTYRRVSSKPKKRRKSNKGKIIGGFLGTIVLIGVIGFALVKFDFIDLDILDGIFNKGDDLSKEVYCKEVSEENVKYDDGILYADNQVSLIANEGVKKREIKKLAKQYGAEIVGYIEFTGDYQLEFSEEKSYDELNSIVSELQLDPNVESASLYRVSQMTSSGGEISNDTPKKGNSNDDTIADDTNVSHRDGELNYDGGTESFYPNDPWGKSDWDKMNPDGKNWGAEAIHATEAWALKDEMDYTKIGLLDTNVDDKHEDLKFEKVWSSKDSSQYAEHGTHVAGIMGAQFGNEKGISGICPKSTLYASDIYGYNYISEMGLKCGLARLILNDVKVINCSFGKGDLCISSSLVNQNTLVNQEAIETIQEDLNYYKETYTIFLNKFIDEGYDFLIVKCAGNENGYYYRMVEKSYENPYGIEVYDPEKHIDISEFTKCENIDAKNDVFSNITDEKLKSRIIVVGADVQYEDGYALSYFSNIGGRVDVLAPGENIYSTVPNNEYDSLGGTSMAAPHVSGLAGMIYGINEDLSASQVKKIIEKTANIDVRNTDKNMINARMAVELAKKIKGEGKNTLSKKGVFLCSVADANKYEIADKSDAEKEQEVGKKAVLQEVKITLKDKDGNEIETLNSDTSGEANILVDPGTYDIVFEKEGYESSILKDVEIKSNDVVYKKVLLRKISKVTGKVVNKNGNSLEGATVTFRNSNEDISAETNSNGSFSKDLKYGTYTLVVSKKGYETKQINVEVNDSQKDLGNITLENEPFGKKIDVSNMLCVIEPVLHHMIVYNGLNETYRYRSYEDVLDLWLPEVAYDIISINEPRDSSIYYINDGQGHIKVKRKHLKKYLKAAFNKYDGSFINMEWTYSSDDSETKMLTYSKSDDSYIILDASGGPWTVATIKDAYSNGDGTYKAIIDVTMAFNVEEYNTYIDEYIVTLVKNDDYSSEFKYSITNIEKN